MDTEDKRKIAGAVCLAAAIGSAIAGIGSLVNPQEEGELCAWFKKGANKESVQVCVKEEELIQRAAESANERTNKQIEAYIKAPSP